MYLRVSVAFATGFVSHGLNEFSQHGKIGTAIEFPRSPGPKVDAQICRPTENKLNRSILSWESFRFHFYCSNTGGKVVASVRESDSFPKDEELVCEKLRTDNILILAKFKVRTITDGKYCISNSFTSLVTIQKMYIYSMSIK